MDETRPSIPATLADRPIVGGLAAPWVNLRIKDGGVDFRSPHQATYERCWTEGLCQACGNPYGRVAILFGGPNQLRSRHFDEPPLCAPCAQYASRACPMVAGRQSHYASRERISEGERGHVCPDAGCSCGGFIASDPNHGDASGEPAHPWYAVYVRPSQWQLTGQEVETYCSDGKCDKPHRRMLVNGALLLGDPVRVVLVSTQEKGRVWRQMAAEEVAELMPSAAGTVAGG